MRSFRKILSDCTARVIALAGKISRELRQENRELSFAYQSPRQDVAQWLPKSGYLVFNDIDEAEAGRIERKLLEAGPGSALIWCISGCFSPGRGTRLVLGAGETRGFYLDDYALEV